MTTPGRPPRTVAVRKLEFEYWVRRRTQVLLNPVARLLSRVGLTPNGLTLLGLLLNVGVAVVLAGGSLRLGGGLLLIASAFDALDGTLARLTGRQSVFGAFFDSTIDRFSEAVVYGGLLYYIGEGGGRFEPLLVYAAIIGSLMVSYARARAEGLRVECRVGLATRADRLVILAVGLLLGWLRPALWLVAILANLTALQRILFVHNELEKQ